MCAAVTCQVLRHCDADNQIMAAGQRLLQIFFTPDDAPSDASSDDADLQRPRLLSRGSVARSKHVALPRYAGRATWHTPREFLLAQCMGPEL